MKIIAMGDIMPGGCLSGSELVLSDAIRKMAQSSDLVIGTLETTLGNDSPTDIYKYSDDAEVCVWSHPKDLEILKDLNVGLVSLANNHMGDFGESGLTSVINELDRLGIKHCGAGANFKEASKPVVIECEGKEYAFLGMCQKDEKFLGKVKYATDSSWGVMGLNENAIHTIEICKQKYDFVYVIAHWGLEFKWIPEDSVRKLARDIIDAGADAIFGGHPHHIQPMDFYKGKPIYYSLGNSVFPQMCIDDLCNVYYPNSTELKSLPTFSRFPIRKHFKMVYYWTKMGQIGMIAKYDSDNPTKAMYALSRFCDNNLDYYRKRVCFSIKYLLSRFLLKKTSSEKIKKIRSYLALVDYVYTYKIKALFNKKYQFYQYRK